MQPIGLFCLCLNCNEKKKREQLEPQSTKCRIVKYIYAYEYIAFLAVVSSLKSLTCSPKAICQEYDAICTTKDKVTAGVKFSPEYNRKALHIWTFSCCISGRKPDAAATVELPLSPAAVCTAGPSC